MNFKKYIFSLSLVTFSGFSLAAPILSEVEIFKVACDSVNHYHDLKKEHKIPFSMASGYYKVMDSYIEKCLSDSGCENSPFNKEEQEKLSSIHTELTLEILSGDAKKAGKKAGELGTYACHYAK